MSDYIHFYNHDDDGTIYAHKLIAFFPNEGKAIFEGYCTIPNTKMPSKQRIYRSHPSTEFNAIYDVEITGVSRKDIQDIVRKAYNDCDTEDCDCCISFFSSDLIILSFLIKKRYTNLSSIDWNYCIDGRFPSPTELIERYSKLLELPEDRYASYESCEDDAPFYTGFHEMMREEKDIFASQFIDPDKKMILRLLKKWREIWDTSISTKNKEFFAKFSQLQYFIEDNFGAMSMWCGEYALKMTRGEVAGMVNICYKARFQADNTS